MKNTPKDEFSYRTVLEGRTKEYELKDLLWFIDEYEKYLNSENMASAAMDSKASIYMGFIISISFAIITLINVSDIGGGLLYILSFYLLILFIAGLHLFTTTQATKQYSTGLIPPNRSGNERQTKGLIELQKEFHVSRFDILDGFCRKMEVVTSKKSKGLIWGQNIFLYGSLAILLILFLWGLTQTG